MIKALTMLGICVIVAASLAFLLMRFLRRLQKIEDARWGDLRKRGHWG